MGFLSAQEEEVIPWSHEARLSWADFKGKPTNTRAAAVTSSGITYRFSSVSKGDEVVLEYEVDTHFYPNKSWYQPAMCDAVILQHEQLHFDITEIYARMMRKRLQDTKFTKNVKSEIFAIYKEITSALNRFQNLYDKETDFSRDLEQQDLWTVKIETALGMEKGIAE
tara:strand:+ start:238 stop:738 length:501 start_codon:yes stop_codon:yes gene_type:complete